jgi:toxin ParE1/3/4
VKNFRLVFTPEASDSLLEIYSYLASQASARTAERYTTAITDYCQSITTLPYQGTTRDDIRPGLRVTNYKGNTVIAFAIDEATLTSRSWGYFMAAETTTTF